MFLRVILFPFSLLYGMITFIRNKLYDWGCLVSIRYEDICVIGVGNITVGGTGKTPHVEYLIRLLSEDFKIAVLSRGYKRRTKGFILADESTTAEKIGDEPYQIKQKFPGIVVAVDVDRVRGIREIRKIHPDIQIVLLDDAFQYRKIKPALSVLLTDHHRPMYRDGVFPGGRMREWICSMRRADVMIVTKSPDDISENDRRDIGQRYARFFKKDLFFTKVSYGTPQPVFKTAAPPAERLSTQLHVLLFTGIASPERFEQYVGSRFITELILTYPDHHLFKGEDISDIVKRWEDIAASDKVMLTTEKDAARLRALDIPSIVADNCYYIPIEVCFIDNDGSKFDREIKCAVEKCLSGYSNHS